LIKEINGEESEKKGENEKDMLSFHTFSLNPKVIVWMKMAAGTTIPPH
jgi:hypothetical protein